MSIFNHFLVNFCKYFTVDITNYYILAVSEKGKIMKRIKQLTGNIVLITIIAFSSFIIMGSAPSAKSVYNDFGDLRNKSYYSDIFTKSELKQLSKAAKLHVKGKSKLKSALTYFKKAEGYKKMADDNRSGKREKYLKSAKKYEAKALKLAFKAYDKLFEYTSVTHDIYKSRLKKMNSDGSAEHKLAISIVDSAKMIFRKGYNIKNNAFDSRGKQRYDFFKPAYNLQHKAIKKQELAFGLFEKDKDIDIKKLVKGKDNKVAENKNKQNRNNKNNNQNNNNNQQNNKVNNNNQNNNNARNNNVNKIKNIQDYDPNMDPNLYRSKETIIIPSLRITSQDSTLLMNADEKTAYANILMKQVDESYLEIDAIRNDAEKERDVVRKQMIIQRAVEKEKDVFVILVRAANLFIQTNEIKYTFYKKYFSVVRPPEKNEISITGAKYEKNAEVLFSDAKNTIVRANLQSYVSEKYLQLMEAIQTELYAIQEQENAYCTYLGYRITPLPLDSGYSENIFVDNTKTDDNKNNKTNENTNKGNKTVKIKKYTYSYSGSYMYSVSQPKPYVLKHKEGTVFKIQTGVFKDLLPLKTFGVYSPISFITFINNPFKKFMVGEYRSTEAAEYVLGKIKETGLKDAFIIAYIDGKQKSYSFAKLKLKTDNSYKKIAKNELAVLKGKPVSSDNDNQLVVNNEINDSNIKYGTGKYDFAKGADIKQTIGVVYAVQIGMFKLPKTNDELKEVKPLLEERTFDGTKFMKGPFTNYESAKKERDILKLSGFTKAFVTVYYNGNNISLGDAKNKVKKEVVIINNQPSVYFAVQIGAYGNKLTNDVEKKFQILSQKYTISSKNDKSGLVIYTVGQYVAYEQAVILKNELKQNGYSDCFVVAFKNEQKIKVGDAIKLIK